MLPPKIACLPSAPQNGRDHGRGGRLAVRARDADHRARAALEKQFQLAGDRDAARAARSIKG